MRIFSKFRDYYDSALNLMGGDDDGVVYTRKTEEFLFGYSDVLGTRPKNTRIFTYIGYSIVGFCGKLYIRYDYAQSKYMYVEIDREEIIKYEIERRRISRYGSYYNDELDDFLNIRTHKPVKLYEFIHPFDLNSFFEKYKTPCFVFARNRAYNWRSDSFVDSKDEKEWKLTINPCLKDIGFHRVVDINTAIQEIRMYFSSYLTNNHTPEMPVGSDEVIAASKGFDKYSFRKLPTKKRK